MRRGSDAIDFAAEVALRTGVEPRVLSGDEEAMYSFLGATASIDGDTPVGVLDVGGGSTELAVDAPSTRGVQVASRERVRSKSARYGSAIAIPRCSVARRSTPALAAISMRAREPMPQPCSPRLPASRTSQR